MQPNGYQPQAYPPPQPTGPEHDPYAFLTTAEKQSSPLNSLLGGKSMKQRLLLIGIVFILLLIILVAIKSILGSGSSSLNQASIGVVLSEQQEIYNLATIASQQTSSQTYQNFTYTAIGTVYTDQNKLTNLLNKNGYPVNSKNYILQPAVDARLTQAQQNNNFDAIYGSIMQQQLQTYLNNLSTAYRLNPSKVIENYLATDYTNGKLLLSLLNQASG